MSIKSRHYKKMSSHGSINIPVAVRRELGLEPKDPLELTVQDGAVTVRPYTPRCTFCGTVEEVRLFADKAVCPACAKKVSEMIGG